MYRKTMITLALLSGLATVASAGSTSYGIKTRTKDGGVFDGYGTDNFIDVTIHGAYGSTGAISIKGHHEMGQEEGYSYTKADVGAPYKITVDVDGQLADKWTPDWIDVTYKGKVTRFDVYRELSYAATDFSVPVKLNKQGQPVNAPEKKIQLAVSDNIGGEGATRSHKVKTSFTEYTQTVVAETDTTSTGVVSSLKYESPASKFGSMSAEVSTSWNNEVSKHNERMNGSSFTQEIEWDFEVPVDSFVIVQRVFEVPIEYQVYTDGLTTFSMRTLGKSPSQLTEVKQQIPHVDSRLGKIIPIRESVILALLDSKNYPGQNVADQRSKYDAKRQYFLDRGYVYTGSQPTIDPNNPFAFETPEPAPAPTPAPTPAPALPVAPTTPAAPTPAAPVAVPEPAPAPAPAAPKFADLVAEIKSVNYGGGKVKIQVIVTNIGDGDAPASDCRVFLSGNKQVNKQRDTKIGLQSVPALAAGASTTLKFTEAIKEEKMSGAFAIAVVDYDGTVEESDESNEFAMKAGKVSKNKKGKKGKKAKKKGKKN